MTEERYNAFVEEDPTPGSTFWYWRVFRDGKLLRDGYRLTSESARERADHEIANDLASGSEEPDQATRLGIASQKAIVDDDRRGPLDALLDQCERIVQWHEQLRMDTPGDEALRMDAVATAHRALDQCRAIRAALDPATLTAAWSQHFDDTAQYAGGFTEPERAGIRAAARMLRDPNVQAQVAKTVGGES